MQLLIDLGNTSIKWALWDGTVLSEMHSSRHHGGLPIDLLAAWDDLGAIDAVRVCSVGPEEVNKAITRLCASLWHCEPAFVRVEPDDSPVHIAYPDPRSLGVDRWLALQAAHQLHSEPKLVIQVGTAITYDALLADGQHLGGLILPGITSMRASLLNTTLIPPHESADPDNALWGTNTGQGIAAACLHAPAALADRLWRQLRQHSGTTPHQLMTGGDAERLTPLLTHPSTYHPDLVLQGLAGWGD